MKPLRLYLATLTAAIANVGLASLSDAQTQPRPNIVWIIAEDLGQDLGAYGNPDVATPALDALAREGVLYRNVFSTSPVCSPSRSALFTGLYQTTIGAHHHRSHRTDGYRLPEGVKLLPERLREAGYFVAQVTAMPAGAGGGGKQDWNFTPAERVWDSSVWSELKAHQPFFAVVNLPEAHRPYKRGGPPIDPKTLRSLPPYIADHEVSRRDWASYLETIQVIDQKAAAILALVEEDGLRDNTIVAFFGDNGREDFRGKSTAFDAGTRVPLIVRWPDRLTAGTKSDRLVSLIDVTASALAVAGVGGAPTHGVPFLVQDTPPRDIIITARDRIEEAVDRVRTAFDGRFRYIRNFVPKQPHLLDRAYYDRTNPVRGLMRDLHAKGQLTPGQAKVFAPERPPEELYDLQADPFELNDLSYSSSPEIRATMATLRAAVNRWMTDTKDRGGEPESPEARNIGGAGRGRGRGGAVAATGTAAGGGADATGGLAGKRGTGTAQPTQVPAAGSAASPAQSAATPASGPATTPPKLTAAASPLSLANLGVMYVGGRTVSSPGGGRRSDGSMQTNVAEQAPVHYVVPEKKTQALSVVMVPGLGLTSSLYLSTPDGREGWAQQFVRRGYAVYVVDEPNNAVSGFDLTSFNAVRAGNAPPATLPGMKLWSNESAWRTWGIGTAPGVPFEDTQFPVAHIDQLYASFTPVISPTDPGASPDPAGTAGAAPAPGPGGRGGRGGGGTTSGRFGSDVKGRALLERVGPSVLIVHSAAGLTAVEALRARPDLVKALVMIEPVGSPTDPAEVKAFLAGTSYLAVFGDHFEVRSMQGRYDACVETARLLAQAGGLAKVIRLPDTGVKGNTHLLMQDRNSHDIARLVMDWLAGHR